MNAEKKYAIITGAGSGLGREFAVQCASMQQNLILIALPGSNLKAIANQLKTIYNVDVKVFEFDMTDTLMLTNCIEMINENYEVDILINNAGVGGSHSIIDCPVEVIDKMLQLNIRSSVLLTRSVIPLLLKNSRSYIINIASMAAFSPIAYKTVYPATKAFISSFSLGLREELFSKGVLVSVACPASIMTNSDVSQRILLQGFKAKMGLLSTQKIVHQILKETFNGRAIIVPGFWNSFNQKVMNLIPTGFKVKLISRNVKQELLSA